MEFRWELALFLAGALAIPAGCLVPAGWLRGLPNDKLLHFIAFGSMALLAARLVEHGVYLALSFAGLFVAGWLIEVAQRWVPGRQFCWRDLAANTVGIITAAMLSPIVAP
jgi:VanZ family protein